MYTKIYKTINNDKSSNNIALAVINMGVIAYREKNFEDSVKYFEEAKEIFI